MTTGIRIVLAVLVCSGTLMLMGWVGNSIVAALAKTVGALLGIGS
jgi:hypothetical protein